MRLRFRYFSARSAVVCLTLLVSMPVNAASVEADSPALYLLISPNSEVRPIYQKPDGFFEGPSWVGGRDGYLVVSAIPDNQLLKVDRRGRVSILARNVVPTPSPNAIRDTLYTNRVLSGSNGTAVVGRHTLCLAQFGGEGVASYDLRTGRIRPITVGSQVSSIHYPNDLVIGPGGDIYFTAHEGIFLIHKGKVSLLKAMAANGLAFTPDMRTLYASDGPTTILKISINADGSAGESRVFLNTHGDPAKHEFLDGMKVDASGNLWAVGPGGIWIINPLGERIGKILAPTVTMPLGTYHRFTNLAFGDPRGTTLYLTAPGGIYSIALARSATTKPAS